MLLLLAAKKREQCKVRDIGSCLILDQTIDPFRPASSTLPGRSSPWISSGYMVFNTTFHLGAYWTCQGFGTFCVCSASQARPFLKTLFLPLWSWVDISLPFMDCLLSIPPPPLLFYAINLWCFFFLLANSGISLWWEASTFKGVRIHIISSFTLQTPGRGIEREDYRIQTYDWLAPMQEHLSQKLVFVLVNTVIGTCVYFVLALGNGK